MRRRRLVKSKSGCCCSEQAFSGSRRAEWLRCRCHWAARWRQDPTLLHHLPPDPRPASSLRRARVASSLMFYTDDFGSLFFAVSGNGNSVANGRRQLATGFVFSFGDQEAFKRRADRWTQTNSHTKTHDTENNGKLTSLPFQRRQTDRRIENTQSDQQLGSKVRAVSLLIGST